MKVSPGDKGAAAGSSAALHGVPVAEWKSLCDSAELVRRLAPWDWMDSSRTFGIGIPGSDQIAFVSIMGKAGNQNHAVFAFLGWEAFVHIRGLLETRLLTVRDLIETPALQLTFMPPADLGSEDLAILKCAGLETPLPDTVPVFRSHQTGYLPWLLNAGEVRQLEMLLRQTAGVVMRCESAPDLLVSPHPGLVWVLSPDASGAWQDEWHPVPSAAEFQRPALLDGAKLAQAAALPCLHERIEFDLALSRATVGQTGQRLQTTYLLAAFDSRDGKCIGADVLLPVDGLAAMWRAVPDRLLNLCLHAESRPREIEVASEQMLATLRPLLGRLPVKLTLRLRLPHFQTFLEEMNSLKHSKESKSK